MQLLILLLLAIGLFCHSARCAPVRTSFYPFFHFLPFFLASS